MTTDKDIFCKIISGEIPSQKITETDDWIAIYDINPEAPVHTQLLIPKRHGSLRDYKNSDTETLGKFITGANNVAQKLGLDKTGYRLVINYGEDSQIQVEDHLHIHILGGKKLGGKLLG